MQHVEHTVPLCLYHKNCLDGIASAWVVWKYFQGAVELRAIQYNDPLPDVKDLQDREVYIVDFSFKADVMFDLNRICKRVVVLDHHATAVREMEIFAEKLNAANLLSNGVFRVVEGKAGVVVVWEYFYGDQPLPEQLKMVQDHDLWNFDLINTKPWAMSVNSYPPNNVEVFDKLMQRPVLELVGEGHTLARKHEQDVRKIAKGFHRLVIDGVEFVAVNANSHYRNEVGDYLGKSHSAVAVYFDGRDRRIYSLRSPKKGGEAVDVIAERFGGGGHRNASSFSIRFTDPRFRNSHIKLRSKGYHWRKLKAMFGFKTQVR